MAKFRVSHKPLDLPMTTTTCTNCGQWLDHEEAIKGAEPIDVSPKDIGAWHRWLNRETPKYEGEWFSSCPTCKVDLSDKPPRDVIIEYIDEYSEEGRLIKKKRHRQKLIAICEKNLHYLEVQIAKWGEIDAPLRLLNSRDEQQEKIQNLQQEIHTIEQRIQNRLARRV